VLAVSTASVATAFLSAHRPATALPIWSALVPWSSLDSLGHMHETLAGDSYHEEIESVPEQTWSSATFFAAAVKGVLGLEVDGRSNRVSFAPHLPPSWNAITIRNVKVGASKINLWLKTSVNETRLEIHNEGVPVKMTFDPEIPLGAKLASARWQDRLLPATVEPHAQDAHAKMEFDVPHGDVRVTLCYAGGVQIWPDDQHLEIGEPSKGMKITRVNLQKGVYTVDFDYVPAAVTDFKLSTPWDIKNVQGARLEEIEKNLYRLNINIADEDRSKNAYQHGGVRVTFASGQ
jgi:hypothetical protein